MKRKRFSTIPGQLRDLARRIEEHVDEKYKDHIDFFLCTALHGQNVALYGKPSIYPDGQRTIDFLASLGMDLNGSGFMFYDDQLLDRRVKGGIPGENMLRRDWCLFAADIADEWGVQ